MISYVEISNIKGAVYNPRIIGKEEIQRLKNSIEKLGFVIPVLVNKKNNVIVAGHQRTRTAKEMGIKEIPVIYVEDMEIGDEVKFNQVHNSIDISLYKDQRLKTAYDKVYRL